MAQVAWTREAADALEEIYEYITEQNPSAAYKVVVGVYDKIKMLRDHPRLGQRYTRFVVRCDAKLDRATVMLAFWFGHLADIA